MQTMLQDESGHKHEHLWRRKNQVNPVGSVHGDILNIEIREGRKIMVQHVTPEPDHCVSNGLFQAIKSTKSKSNIPPKCSYGCSSENIVIDQIVTDSQTVNHAGNASSASSTNPVIFFIHGVGGSAKLWKHQVEYFYQENYEIVVPDLLGHGLSSAPKHKKAYTFSELSEDMLVLFDAFAKEENILIGHSYGSSFCVKLAHERSNQVSKVILISGGGPQSLKPQPCQIFCLPAFILSCIKPMIVNGFIKRAFKDPSQQAKLDKNNSFNASASVLHAMMNGQDWAEGDRNYHAALNTPILLIYGTQDQFIGIDEEHEMIETICDCRMKTVEAGHMVMLEAPYEVNELIDDFINQHPSERVVQRVPTF
ncbi:protein ABHD8-like [Antedon mediterranea]|uniref:protein ABHD8-like n=1 Tax=Antedon mediterranea TaxID=105859 RepID=UPI003AF6D7A0